MDAVVCAFYLNDCFMMFFLSLDLHALSHVLMSFIWWIDRLNSVQNERFMHFSYPLKWSLNFLFEFHNEKFFIRALIVLWEHQNSNNLICWIQSFNLRRFRIWCTYCSRIYLYLCKYWMKYFKTDWLNFFKCFEFVDTQNPQKSVTNRIYRSRFYFNEPLTTIHEVTYCQKVLRIQ